MDLVALTYSSSCRSKDKGILLRSIGDIVHIRVSTHPEICCQALFCPFSSATVPDVLHRFPRTYSGSCHASISGYSELIQSGSATNQVHMQAMCNYCPAQPCLPQGQISHSPARAVAQIREISRTPLPSSTMLTTNPHFYSPVWCALLSSEYAAGCFSLAQPGLTPVPAPADGCCCPNRPDLHLMLLFRFAGRCYELTQPCMPTYILARTVTRPGLDYLPSFFCSLAGTLS